MSPSARARFVNAALVLVALALVGVVLATGGSVTTSEREARSFNVLAAFRESEITRLEVEQDKKSFALERELASDGGASDWMLVEPDEEEADLLAMQSALGTLEFASWVRRIKPEEVDRAAFGLDNPSLVIHVDMGSIHYRLRLGREAASPPGSHYLEVTGEGAPRKGVVIVDKNLVEALHFKADDFRGRYIMPYLSHALSRFTVTGTGGERRFKKAKEWDGWRFDGMYDDARVNRQVLDRILVQFARTLAEDFIDSKDAAAAQQGAELVTVRMTPEDESNPPGEVVVGAACPRSPGFIVARRIKPDPVAACVPANVYAGLATPAEALVDRTLFHMRTDEVEVLTIRAGEQTLELARKGTGYLLRRPREADVDREAGDARLEALWHATGKVIDAPNLEKLGLRPAFGQVVVTSAAADDASVEKEVVDVSAPRDDGAVYVRREQDGIVLELRREAARTLTPDASLVRSRVIFDIPMIYMRKVVVEGHPRQEVHRSDAGDFTLVEPKGFDVDPLLATELMDSLRTLTADRWVADQDDGSYGLEKPSLVARFTVQKDDEPAPEEHGVVVGRPAPSGYYASLEGDPGVFILPRRVYEVLTHLLLDRSVFAIDPEITARVTLETPERRVVLERLGDQFIQSEGSEQLDDAAIQRIVDALSVMRPEAAVALGSPKPAYGLGAPVLTVRAEMEPGLEQGSKPIEYRIGSGDSWRSMTIYYGTVRGIDAVYVLPRASVQRVLDAL